jgi:colanic acid biosynthesis glycosyl transferase WcaI
MRFLILSHFYAPETIPKPHELAVGLIQKGHEVNVVTGIPNYPHGKFYPGYHLRPWQWEVRDGVRILRVPVVPDHSTSPVRRMLNYLSFMAASSLLGPLGAGKADAMYVWHPPLTVGVSAWVIGLMRRIPFVYGVHDLWPEAVEATGMLTNQRMLGWMGKLERFVYRQASSIAVISPGYKKNLEGKGVPPEKVHVITDWANESIYRPVDPDGALSEQMGMDGRFNVMFGGNMGPSQALGTVIEAAQRLANVPEIQFVFAGDGMEQPRLESMIQEKGLTNVRFLGRQPAETMPHLYANSEVLLAHFRKGPLFEISVPGKLFAYLACQRPVLMASKGDAADMVNEAGAGVTCAAEDPTALAEAVMKLYYMTPEQRQKLGMAGRQAFQQKYSREILLRRHEELLIQAGNRKASAVPAE